MTTIKGQFDVRLLPQTESSIDKGLGIDRMQIEKRYHGDLTAIGKGQMLSHRTIESGSAGYVAIEHVSGNLLGKTGSFVLQHFGIMDSNDKRLQICIIPDSATGDLVGLSGEMAIDVIDGQHHYHFDYYLPE